MPDDLHTTELRALLARSDPAARNELLRRVGANLERLARKLLHSYPSVRRWEGTDDVLQNATVRLLRALEAVTPENPRQFFGLAAEQIRRELLDLARHHYGPRGVGANHASGTIDAADDRAAADLDEWRELHERVAELPDDEREAFGLVFYQSLTPAEAAQLLGVAPRTFQRRWQNARLRLHSLLAGRASGESPS